MKRLLITFEFWLLVVGTAAGAIIGASGAIPWIPV